MATVTRVRTGKAILKGFPNYLPLTVFLALVVWAECLYAFEVHWPPVGTFVALLGLTAALVTIWPPNNVWSKAGWIVVFCGFTVLEINNLYKDRSKHDQEQHQADFKHDREQKEARDQQLSSFKEISDGLQVAIRESQRQFDSTMRKQAESINTITGGDSFCYMEFIANMMTDSGGFPIFVHRGKYPLSGVHARIVNLWKFEELANLGIVGLQSTEQNMEIGSLPPFSTISLRNEWFIPFSNKDEQRFNIFFSSDKNGFWTENIRLRKLNGRWLPALKVFRLKNNLEVEAMKPIIDKEYPRDEKGNVQWN